MAIDNMGAIIQTQPIQRQWDAGQANSVAPVANMRSSKEAGHGRLCQKH